MFLYLASNPDIKSGTGVSPGVRGIFRFMFFLFFQIATSNLRVLSAHQFSKSFQAFVGRNA